MRKLAANNCSARSESLASSRMIAADLPPSSRVTGRRSWAHVAAIWRPAAVEPVKDTLSTPGWLTRYAPASLPPGTMLFTPSGTPPSMTPPATKKKKIKHRLWRRLYNKRATGSKRWRDLQERKNLGGVEWRDRSNNAYRLTPHESSPSLFLTS